MIALQQPVLRPGSASLAHLPTRLEILPRLSKHLGGPDIWIKRDDCTGLATGGNKARKLEFSMGEALERGADTIITVGAVQSNHVRQAAAAAARLGMRCEVLLEHRVRKPGNLYLNSGNVLLDRLLGANLREYDKGTDFGAAMDEIAGEVRVSGGTPYIIPGGASNPVGALGYVGCAEELLQQCEEQDVAFDHVVLASGSAGTHAGFAVGGTGHRGPRVARGRGQDGHRPAVVKLRQAARHEAGAEILEGQRGAVEQFHGARAVLAFKDDPDPVEALRMPGVEASVNYAT